MLLIFLQDSYQLSTCEPGYSRHRVRGLYRSKGLFQAHFHSSSRRDDWFDVMQISDWWKCRLGWSSLLGSLSGCNRL